MYWFKKNMFSLVLGQQTCIISREGRVFIYFFLFFVFFENWYFFILIVIEPVRFASSFCRLCWKRSNFNSLTLLYMYSSYFCTPKQIFRLRCHIYIQPVNSKFTIRQRYNIRLTINRKPIYCRTWFCIYTNNTVTRSWPRSRN